MNIAILGYARDGQAAYDYWSQQGHDLTICDEDTSIKVPEGAKAKLGKDWLKDLNQFDGLVRTAGLPPSKIADANPEAPNILDKVTGNITEFMRVSPTQNIIGVTGTKGKGTTSTLIAKMLEAAGHRVHLGGNIGIPALELLKQNIGPHDWVVLEQSSFQLIDQKLSPHIGVCLMVVPEHLNWHKDMDEYVTAKQQLFAYQTPDDIAIYYAKNELSTKIASVSPGTKIPYYQAPGAAVADDSVVIDNQVICKTSEIKLLGEHNWQNICAAVTAVWQVAKKPEAMRSVITSFSGLEHRLEKVGEIGGVSYYDDSFGTTPETAIVAIQAFKEPKVVIVGGSDKGADYAELVRTIVESNVKHVVAIGVTGATIANLLAANTTRKVPVTTWGADHQTTMSEIIEAASKQAVAGDIVLLSTGSASFGLFTDYKDRGDQFRREVQARV